MRCMCLLERPQRNKSHGTPSKAGKCPHKPTEQPEYFFNRNSDYLLQYFSGLKLLEHKCAVPDRTDSSGPKMPSHKCVRACVSHNVSRPKSLGWGVERLESEFSWCRHMLNAYLALGMCFSQTTWALKLAGFLLSLLTPKERAPAFSGLAQLRGSHIKPGTHQIYPNASAPTAGSHSPC